MIVPEGSLIAPFSLVFECYGARVGVSTNEATILDSLPEHLPVKSKLIDSSDLENQFTLLTNEVARSREGTDTYRSSPDAVLRPREKALIPVIVLCSLGLWWAIWLAVAHLVYWLG
jgi:hypothetical protein